MIVGIPFNPLSPTLSARLTTKAQERAIPYRQLHLPTLRIAGSEITDMNGQVTITHLAPGTTYGENEAHEALIHLEASGVVALNPLNACSVADDKIRTCEALRSAGLRQPRWEVVHAGDIAALSRFGYPLVVKRPTGALGMWNRLAHDKAGAITALDELLAEGGDRLLVQELVREALGRSLRVVVLQDRVLAVTELVAEAGEWRSNGALGATGYDVTPTETERELAIAGLSAVGLGYGGVDLLRAADGPVLIEVNAGSSFDGAERRTGQDIAGALLDALLAL
jgi:ribosomal protein S6--L-glutamate ligase